MTRHGLEDDLLSQLAVLDALQGISLQDADGGICRFRALELKPNSQMELNSSMLCAEQAHASHAADMSLHSALNHCQHHPLPFSCIQFGFGLQIHIRVHAQGRLALEGAKIQGSTLPRCHSQPLGMAPHKLTLSLQGPYKNAEMGWATFQASKCKFPKASEPVKLRLISPSMLYTPPACRKPDHPFCRKLHRYPQPQGRAPKAGPRLLQPFSTW